jgi:hypothetical protein
MNSAPDIQTVLQQQLKSCSWQLTGTITMGVIAATLALFGQNSLALARPLFPMIDQIYGAWQGWYVGALLIFGLVWAIALVRQLNGLQYLLTRLKAEQRLEQQRALRESRRMAAKQAPKPEPERARPLPANNGRSNKFDY